MDPPTDISPWGRQALTGAGVPFPNRLVVAYPRLLESSTSLRLFLQTIFLEPRTRAVRHP
ncbi:MAG TPA: hypothetical protein VLV78_11970 [Thermoanaerobaculia bacterium]|nr:hypothetical protein [Thermoanaerobaculia bacterium]